MYFKKKKVFISYAREDKIYADELFAYLKANGHHPFQDMKSIVGGEVWQKRTRAEMRKADAIIPLISDTSVNKEGFIKYEFAEVKQLLEKKRLKIIPIRLTPTAFHPYFSDINTIEWTVENKVALLRQLDTINRKWWIMGVLVLLLLLLSSWYIFRTPNDFKFEFQATTIDQTTQVAIPGVVATLITSSGDTLARSMPSNADGKLTLLHALYDTTPVQILFYHQLYAPKSVKYSLHRGRIRPNVLSTLVRKNVIYFSARSSRYTLIGMNLMQIEWEHIEHETGFQLAHQAALSIAIEVDRTSFQHSKHSRKVLFPGGTVFVIGNGRKIDTGIYIASASASTEAQLLKLLQKRTQEQLTLNREEVIDTIIRCLQPSSVAN